MGSHDSPKDQAIIDFIHKTNAENNGLFFAVRSWIADGWGLTEYALPEQLAAALLMEAGDQDRHVARGESSPEYPATLRKIAFELLSLAGHIPRTTAVELPNEELRLVIECVHRRIVTLNLGAEQFGADSAEKDIRRRDSAVLQAIKAKLEQGASDGGERQG